MKKRLFLFILLVLFQTIQIKSQLSFSIVNVSGSNSITCASSHVILQLLSNYTGGPTNYTINPATYSVSGNSYSFSIPATYSITAFASGSVSSTLLYTIAQNTITPSSTITPLYQSVTCSNNAIQSITASASPSMNVEYDIFWAQGGIYSGINSPTLLVTSPPTGTHTLVITNLINGCKTTKNFTVAATGFPGFNVISPIQNFSLGCVPKHTVDIAIINPITDPLGSAISFAVLVPGASTVPVFGALSAYTFNIPGTYTVILKDGISQCQTRLPISIIQNITAPYIEVTAATNTLSCFIQSVTLVASSNTTSASFQWNTPSSIFQGNTMTATITSNPNQTVVGTYTCIATSISNACKSVTLFPIFKNTFVPHALINTIPSGSGTITCNTPSVLLSNNSSTGIPPLTFSNNLPVTALLWEGTSLNSLPNSNTYTAPLPGIYTLTVQDLNNGCNSSTVISIADGRDYPQVNSPVAAGPFSISCPATSANIYANLISNAACSYSWFTSQNIYLSSGSTIPPANTVSTSVNAADSYLLVVMNTVSGCVSLGTVSVYGCVGIHENQQFAQLIHLFPNPSKGAFTIDLASVSGDFQIKIYNSQGFLLEEYPLQKEEKRIDLGTAPVGIYLIQIFESDRLRYYSKLLKE